MQQGVPLPLTAAVSSVCPRLVPYAVPVYELSRLPAYVMWKSLGMI